MEIKITKDLEAFVNVQQLNDLLELFPYNEGIQVNIQNNIIVYEGERGIYLSILKAIMFPETMQTVSRNISGNQTNDIHHDVLLDYLSRNKNIM